MQTKNSTGADHAPLAYRVAHFCRAIGIGRTKFYELMASGKIRTIVVGGRRLIRLPRRNAWSERERVMRRSLDFSAVNAAALPALPALCARWLPGGEM